MTTPVSENTIPVRLGPLMFDLSAAEDKMPTFAAFVDQQCTIRRSDGSGVVRGLLRANAQKTILPFPRNMTFVLAVARGELGIGCAPRRFGMDYQEGYVLLGWLVQMWRRACFVLWVCIPQRQLPTMYMPSYGMSVGLVFQIREDCGTGS